MNKMSNLTPLTSTLLRLRDHLKDEQVMYDSFIEMYEMNKDYESMAHYECLYDEAGVMLLELNVLIARLVEAGVVRYE